MTTHRILPHAARRALASTLLVTLFLGCDVDSATDAEPFALADVDARDDDEIEARGLVCPDPIDPYSEQHSHTWSQSIPSGKKGYSDMVLACVAEENTCQKAWSDFYDTYADDIDYWRETCQAHCETIPECTVAYLPAQKHHQGDCQITTDALGADLDAICDLTYKEECKCELVPPPEEDKGEGQDQGEAKG